MQIKITEEDFVKAHKLAFPGSRGELTARLWGGSFILLAVFLEFTLKFSYPLKEILAFFVFCFGISLVFYKRMQLKDVSKKLYKSSQNLHRPINFEFYDGGVAFESDHDKREVKWEAYVKARKNMDFLLFYATEYFFDIIPRAQLPEEKWEELIRISKERIKDFEETN